MSAVDDVLGLLAEWGDGYYGEVVDQRRHALQCAVLAERSGAGDVLVAAALLHDIGHLVSAADQGLDPSPPDNDRHEAVGAQWVAARFGPAVARPVALHVLAKRYQCTVDPGYRAALSPASTFSLELQGGVLDGRQVIRFEAGPGHAEALCLRAWDEAAKDPDAETPGVEAFLPVLERLAAGS